MFKKKKETNKKAQPVKIANQKRIKIIVKKNDRPLLSILKNPSIIFSFILILLVVLLAIGIKVTETTYVISTPSYGTHKTVEKIPFYDIETYEVIEEYKDKIPFGTKNCAPRQMNFSIDHGPLVLQTDKHATCSITVTNLENETGDWSYRAEIVSYDATLPNVPVKKRIYAFRNNTFEWNFQIEQEMTGLTCKYYQESVPSMIKCFYAEPINYQYVTKTRAVEKNRTVTKYKEVETWSNTTTYTNTSKVLTVVTIFGKDILHVG